MTHKAAIYRAQRVARRTAQTMYVIYESGEYDTSTEEELDTFWAGARVEDVIEKSGEIAEKLEL